MAGESPDRSEQRKSSGNGSAGLDPRLGDSENATPAGRDALAMSRRRRDDTRCPATRTRYASDASGDAKGRR